MNALKGAAYLQKALHGSYTYKRKLLEGTKEKNILPYERQVDLPSRQLFAFMQKTNRIKLT